MQRVLRNTQYPFLSILRHLKMLLRHFAKQKKGEFLLQRSSIKMKLLPESTHFVRTAYCISLFRNGGLPTHDTYATTFVNDILESGAIHGIKL